MTSRTGGEPRILTINSGSSSLKAALFTAGAGEPSLIETRRTDRIGAEGAEFSDFPSAVDAVISEFGQRSPANELAGIGHRVVHGGSRHSAPEMVSPQLLSDLRALFPVDPEHLPQAVAAIEAIARRLPDVPQVACFDTHFHDGMAPESKRLPLPRWLETDGVRRYGFHGLSYESIMMKLNRIDPDAAQGKIVIAHLGAGASMAAVRDGRGLDTTMGFTPTGGLMMGTRPGDIDPGLLLYLLQVRRMTADDINRLLNKESGLLGVSGTSQDMRDLLAAEPADHAAGEAVSLFCHIAKKHLAGLVATLGGLDTLIFTGGIGEHAAPIRARICDNLGFLGISLDPNDNESDQPVISSPGSTTTRVMNTNEELMIARHTARLLNA